MTNEDITPNTLSSPASWFNRAMLYHKNTAIAGLALASSAISYYVASPYLALTSELITNRIIAGSLTSGLALALPYGVAQKNALLNYLLSEDVLRLIGYHPSEGQTIRCDVLLNGAPEVQSEKQQVRDKLYEALYDNASSKIRPKALKGILLCAKTQTPKTHSLCIKALMHRQIDILAVHFNKSNEVDGSFNLHLSVNIAQKTQYISLAMTKDELLTLKKRLSEIQASLATAPVERVKISEKNYNPASYDFPHHLKRMQELIKKAEETEVKDLMQKKEQQNTQAIKAPIKTLIEEIKAAGHITDAQKIKDAFKSIKRDNASVQIFKQLVLDNTKANTCPDNKAKTLFDSLNKTFKAKNSLFFSKGTAALENPIIKLKEIYRQKSTLGPASQG